MTRTPYIRFYGDDWLSGTLHLDLEERGALITIMALTASTGRAPEADYKRLGRRMGCTANKAKKVITSLVDLGKLEIVDGLIVNKRAIKETEISRKNSEKQAENAAARWSKSEEKPNKNNGTPDAMAMPPHKSGISQPEPEPEPYKEDTNVSLSLEAPSPDIVVVAFDLFKASAEVSGWPVPRILNSARKSALRARLKECGGIEGWKVALEKASNSSHCCGQNQRGWVLTFDFITKATSFAKLMEGNYDDRDNNNGHASPNGGGYGGTGSGGRVGSGTTKAFATVAQRLGNGPERGGLDDL